jgi:hypothetical protein
LRKHVGTSCGCSRSPAAHSRAEGNTRLGSAGGPGDGRPEIEYIPSESVTVIAAAHRDRDRHVTASGLAPADSRPGTVRPVEWIVRTVTSPASNSKSQSVVFCIRSLRPGRPSDSDSDTVTLAPPDPSHGQSPTQARRTRTAAGWTVLTTWAVTGIMSQLRVAPAGPAAGRSGRSAAAAARRRVAPRLHVRSGCRASTAPAGEARYSGLGRRGARYWRESQCQVYTWYILWPYRNVTGTEKAEKVLSRCMPGIYCMASYERFTHVLYQVYYTWYILFINSLYQVYAWYIAYSCSHGTFRFSMMSYTRYMFSIYH